MSPLLDELWVFSRAGVPLVEFGKEGKVDKALLGCFISAIQSFSQQTSGKKIKSFNVGKNKFTCAPCFQDNIILVCRSPLEVKMKDLLKICEIISKLFEGMFNLEEITQWNGDLSLFDKFKNKLDLYFKMGDL